MCHLHVNRNGWNIAVRRCRRAVVRYEFWLKELVRIKKEAALAGQIAAATWDFSDPNAITRERIPAAGDLTPMRWFWEALALSQGHRRPRPRLRPPPSRAGAAAAGGYRDERRRAHRTRQERACGLGLRQL
jgi:hypothetical protein